MKHNPLLYTKNVFFLKINKYVIAIFVEIFKQKKFLLTIGYRFALLRD